MSWLMILAALMPLLEMLIRWLSGRTSLTEKQQTKLNNLIHKCNQIRDKSCSMGCKPEGTMEAFEAGDDIDVNALAGELIDDALADEGFKAHAGFDRAAVQGKLTDFIKKLRDMGFTWGFIFECAKTIVPMILSGTIDWDAILALLEKLKPVPTPTPGPLSP